MNTYLFVYGTLRRHHPSRRQQLFGADWHWLSYGYLQGRLYEVDNYPGAVLSDNPAERVVGEVYVLADSSVLSRLDDYEECSQRFPEPQEYYRTLTDIVLLDSSSVTAWVYLYHWDVSGLMPIAGGDYLAWQNGGS